MSTETSTQTPNPPVKSKTDNTQKIVKLPSGEKIAFKVTPSPERSTKKFVLSKVKYHIKQSVLEKKLDENIWPVIDVINQALGGNSIPEDVLWTGKKEDWTILIKQDRERLQIKRVEKLRAIRSCQTAFRKLNKEEWEAIKKIFTISKQTYA